MKRNKKFIKTKNKKSITSLKTKIKKSISLFIEKKP